jgi:hypothetical protein
MKEKRYFRKTKLYEREMALADRMSLVPGLLWLTINLVLIIQVYHKIMYI